LKEIKEISPKLIVISQIINAGTKLKQRKRKIIIIKAKYNKEAI
jgi:hypothetical protein